VARLQGVFLRYGKTLHSMTSTLSCPPAVWSASWGRTAWANPACFSLVAGSRAIQAGRVEVPGTDMADAGHRRMVCPRIAYSRKGSEEPLSNALQCSRTWTSSQDYSGRIASSASGDRQSFAVYGAVAFLDPGLPESSPEE